MHLRRLILIVNVCLCLIAAVCAHAQTGTIRGRVLIEGDSSSVVGASVQLLHSLDGAPVDSSGHYVVRHLAPGPNVLRVAMVGYHPIDCPVSIKADTIANVDFLLRKITSHTKDGDLTIFDQPPKDYSQTHSKVSYRPETGTLKGHVVDDRGEALIGAVIRHQRNLSWTTSDVSGRFQLLGLPTGPDTLWVGSIGYKSRRLPFIVSADSTVVLKIKMEEQATPGGEPIFPFPARRRVGAMDTTKSRTTDTKPDSPK